MDRRIEQTILDRMAADKRVDSIIETMECWNDQELNKMIELNIIQRLIIKIKEIINGLK